MKSDTSMIPSDGRIGDRSVRWRRFRGLGRLATEPRRMPVAARDGLTGLDADGFP